MSHELRTPLNSLLILSKLLADNADATSPTKQVEFAQTIHTAGNDLLALINDILDLSKVEAGKMDVQPDARSRSTTIARATSSAAFRPVADEKGSAFEIELADERARRRSYRRAAPAADPAQPALQRVQVHREGQVRCASSRAGRLAFATSLAR